MIITLNNILETLLNLLIPLLILVILIFCILAVWFFWEFSPKNKCKICGKNGKDDLSENEDKFVGRFCRTHLIEKYSELFLKSQFSKVIVELDPSNYPSVKDIGKVSYYPYIPLIEIKPKLNGIWNDNDNQILKSLIDSIHTHKCSHCQDRALAMFISKDKFEIEKYFYKYKFQLTKYIRYTIKPKNQFKDLGIYLCNKHALEKIIPNIQNFKGNFNNYGGLFLPFREDGYQVPTIDVNNY